MCVTGRLAGRRRACMLTGKELSMRKLVGALAFCVVLGAFLESVRADGPRDEARIHFANGEKYFQSGDYKHAIGEFQAADKLVPSPILVYNIALCFDRLGDEEQAANLYRQYL